MFSVEFKSSNSSQRFRYPNDVTEFNVPNGFLHRETNTHITSNLDVLKLLATHGTVDKTTGNRSIVFHDRHHWTRLVSRFQLCALIWVVCNLLVASNGYLFWKRLIDFGIVYALSYVPEIAMEIHERSERGAVKDFFRSLDYNDEKRLAELCEIHNYNKIKILKDLFK
jgi:hypothetical protein